MKKLLAFLVIIGLGLAGVAYWVSPRRSANGEDLFTVAPAEFGALADTVGGSGAFQPRETLIIMPKVAGHVVEIAADFNQVVEEGDVLLRIDDESARLKLKEAEAAVRLAQKGVKAAEQQRNGAEVVLAYTEKLRDGVRMQSALDKAKFDRDAAEEVLGAAREKVELAELARQQAQLGLDLTVIRVPRVERPKDQPALEKISEAGGPGAEKRKWIVLDRKAVLGRNIGPQETAPLFTLVSDLDQLQLHALIAEGDISKVKVGQGVEFTVAAHSDSDKPFAPGKVAEIRPMPASEMGAIFYRAIIDVTNDRDATGAWRLLPGMTASVDVVRRKHENVWILPAAALSFQLEEQFLTEAARAKMTRWDQRADRELWKPVWVLDNQKKPWPIYVRIAGKNKDGNPPIRDSQHVEVLEWDPELKPAPDPKTDSTIPKVITGQQTAGKTGLFNNMPSIKF